MTANTQGVATQACGGGGGDAGGAGGRILGGATAAGGHSEAPEDAAGEGGAPAAAAGPSAAAEAAEGGAPPREAAEDAGCKTTLMIRNLPEGFTMRLLEELLDAEGFAGRYDFAYLPSELASGAPFGYAFVNLVSPADATRFHRCFHGFTWPSPSSKRAAVHVSEVLQGLEQQIERYRNSPLMHPSVPDVARPVLYRGGSRVAFPEPTVPLRPPRLRASGKRGARHNTSASSNQGVGTDPQPQRAELEESQQAVTVEPTLADIPKPVRLLSKP